MEIEYATGNIAKVCTNVSVAERKYGCTMAEKIHLRIDQIRSAATVEQMIQYNIGRCHPLHNNRQGQYAVDLVHPMRLVFEKKGNSVQIANIIEITDYHR